MKLGFLEKLMIEKSQNGNRLGIGKVRNED